MGAQDHFQIRAFEGAIAVLVDADFIFCRFQFPDKFRTFRMGDGDLVGGVGRASSLGQPGATAS